MKKLFKWKTASLCRNLADTRRSKLTLPTMGARKIEHVCNHEETDKPKLKDKLQNKWATLFRKRQGHERKKN